jgi:hypothetical protein
MLFELVKGIMLFKIVILTLLFNILPIKLTAQNLVNVDCSELERDGSYARIEQYHHGPVREAHLERKFGEWGVKIMRAFAFKDIFVPAPTDPDIDYDVLLGQRNKWQVNAIYTIEEQCEDAWMLPWKLAVDKMGKGDNFDYVRYDKICIDMLKALKRRFPKLTYIEVRNEPTNFHEGPFYSPTLPDFRLNRWSSERKDVFNRLYLGLAKAIQEVNLEVNNGAKLKIAGPSIISFFASWIDSTIDYAAANNLPLDVVAWHNYSDDNYEDALGHVKHIQDKMQQAGFTDYEMIVSEYGTKGKKSSDPTSGTFADMSAIQLNRVAVRNLDLAAAYTQAGVHGIMPWYHQWNDTWAMSMFGYQFMEYKQANTDAEGWTVYDCVPGSSDTQFYIEPIRTPDGSITRVKEIQLIDKDGNVLSPTVNAAASALIDGDTSTIWEGDSDNVWATPKIRLNFATKREVAKVRVYFDTTQQNRISISYEDNILGILNVLGDYPIYPQGHVMDMGSMLKDKLLNVNFPVNQEDIRSLATIDGNEISLMVWNRNETQSVSGNLELTNIPAGMGATLKGIRYLTDQETANYMYDPENYAMTPSTMADITIDSNRTAQIHVDLKPLAIALLTFDGDGNLGIYDNRNNLPEYCYPNPVRNILNIPSSILSDGKFTQYSIFDMAGNEIKIGNINRNRQINCNTLKAGIYIIKIHMAENKVKRQVFVKN